MGLSSVPFPVLWVRFPEGGPAEPGVYLRASDVAAWLRGTGFEELAAELEYSDDWLETERHDLTTGLWQPPGEE